jgi:hypothetical protein
LAAHARPAMTGERKTVNSGRNTFTSSAVIYGIQSRNQRKARHWAAFA